MRNVFRVGFFRKKYKKIFLGKNFEGCGRKVRYVAARDTNQVGIFKCRGGFPSI